MVGLGAFRLPQRGLGSEWKIDPNTGNYVDCDSIANITVGACWDPQNPAVTGPGSTTVASPIWDSVIGASNPSTGQQLTPVDTLSALLGSSSNLVWAGLVALGVLLLLKRK